MSQMLGNELYANLCIEKGFCPIKISYLASPETFPPYRHFLQKSPENNVTEDDGDKPNPSTETPEMSSHLTTETGLSSSAPPPSPSECNKSRKRLRGQNKDRSSNFAHLRDLGKKSLCMHLAVENSCPDRDACYKSHEVELPVELELPLYDDPDEKCPSLKALGVCLQGLNCRVNPKLHIFNGMNVDCDGKIVDSQMVEAVRCKYKLTRHEHWRKKVRERKIYPKSEVSLKLHCPGPETDAAVTKEANEGCVVIDEPISGNLEKKRRQLKSKLQGKLILAPLTTVGNLPFRRLCIKYGADVTVSEMAVGTALLQGSPTDLAVLKRHPDEKIFGIQVAGGYADNMSKVAEVLEDWMMESSGDGSPSSGAVCGNFGMLAGGWSSITCDFVDVNMGCPLDSMGDRGAGSQLMTRENHLRPIVQTMSEILSVPLTIKMRTGHRENKPRTAHQLVPKLCSWGVSGITVHGRTGQQRYAKYADWDYIKECRNVCSENVTFIGNGDIFDPSVVELYRSDAYNMDALAIGRGALIKPWIFTEVKDGKLWDISATERFDMLKDFCRMGIEHWGSDQKGIETTRRFLLENLSFMYRYVPIALLERLPQKMNLRPPLFVGRNELETIMGSSASRDWILLSERLLGKVADGFTFTPKHKSNSYND